MTERHDNIAQKASKSYVLPAIDSEFLLSDSMRGVRFLLEYSKAEQTLKSWGIRSTIVVFGSARVHEDGTDLHARWYNTARDFGRIASEQGGSLTRTDGYLENVIATGGGPGIMEAANRGARDAGAPTIGFNITLPHEQEPNAYTTPQLTFRFHYFAMRKMHLAMRANALVVFPGGFGTFDELFELLTLGQTHKATRIPVVLVDKAYWTKVINFQALADYGMIREEDIGLVHFAESAQEIWDHLVSQDIGSHRDHAKRYGGL
ncbi:LOG family protein [Oryzibacter oryziterrae]|uniref:LOG family protein n=1 Tax=Oryzibacter oryziterrae TaxID=2766474 RepID=UPI001F361A79|nr:TIGR00730 family Rossman fold protein [Oryzibacter oryziterrae]